MGLGRLNPGCNTCGCVPVAEQCRCNLVHFGCDLYWNCYGDSLCGSRLLHNGIVISTEPSGVLYAPAAGDYELQKCCDDATVGTVWTVAGAVTIPQFNCLPCGCERFDDPTISQVTLDLPLTWGDLFNGTYVFSNPLCFPQETFYFDQPLPHPTPPPFGCDWANVDQWAADNDDKVKVYTYLWGNLSLGGMNESTVYLWPDFVAIGVGLGGITGYPFGSANVAFYGLMKIKLPYQEFPWVSQCSPYIAGGAAYFGSYQGLPFNPVICSPVWTRYHIMKDQLVPLGSIEGGLFPPVNSLDHIATISVS